MSIKKLAGLAACALMLLGTASAGAQNGMAYGRSQAPAPLEGTWDVVITPYACSNANVTFPSFRSRLMFNAGGTMIESPFNPSFQPGQRSHGLGTWERTGRESYRTLFEAFIYFTSVVTPPTPPRYLRGVQRIDQGIEMQGTDRWTSSAQVTAVDEAGSPYMAGCMTAEGTRQQ